MKLRTKVFCIFTSVAIIPLLILTVFAYGRYRDIIHQRMDDISSTLFDNALEQANGVLEGIKQAAGTFTFYSDSDFSIVENLQKFSDSQQPFNPYDEFKSNQNIKFMCQNILYTYDDLYSIYVFTPSGAILGGSSHRNGELQLRYDPTGDGWYQDTVELDGGLYVSPVGKHTMFTGNKDSVFFAQSLRDVYTHEFLGVLVLNYDPSIFDLSLVNTMPDIALLTIDNTETSAVLYSNIDGFASDFPDRHRQIMKQDLAISPLRLTAVIDYDTLFDEFSLTAMLLILIAGACALGIILLSYALSKNLVYPLEHLSRKMASQKGHSLEMTGRYLNRTDEIGTLYNEYNSMVEELNASVKKDYEDRLVILDAQMKSLEARINSHFLFNTLESINSMAELEDNEQIATMSLALGNMFRYTIKTQSELVTIAQELGHVSDYVAIQQIRFSNRFQLLIEMENSLKSQKVLKLILQPLVENALYHGLKYCTIGDTIMIRGWLEGNCILLEVSDNGQGMTQEQLESLTRKLKEEPSFTELGHRNKQSIGLKNIHSRIELYYGRGYGPTIRSCQNQGTSIQIRLPLIAKEDNRSCTPI